MRQLRDDTHLIPDGEVRVSSSLFETDYWQDEVQVQRRRILIVAAI